MRLGRGICEGRLGDCQKCASELCYGESEGTNRRDGRGLREAMTVSELIRELEAVYDKELPVAYGDGIEPVFGIHVLMREDGEIVLIE